MPTVTISEFLEDTREDHIPFKVSHFAEKVPDIGQTLSILEARLDSDREGLTKLKKAIKVIHNSGRTHIDNEMYLVHALEGYGGAIIDQDEPDMGAAFLKFSVVATELSALMKTLMTNINNIVMFPLDSLLKNELRAEQGDMKRLFDKAAQDYETKLSAVDREKQHHDREVASVLGEFAKDDMLKERRRYQLHACEYLLHYKEIRTKTGLELVEHFIDYYHALNNYFQDGLKTIEHFGIYVTDLKKKLGYIKQQQDAERMQLLELKTLLQSSNELDGKDNLENLESNRAGAGSTTVSAHSLHQLQADEPVATRTGYLMKKVAGKLRHSWQKRRCHATSDGFLDIYHADETKLPTRVNLLTCQVKPSKDDKNCFDVISYNRAYHFKAADEAEQKAWTAVLINCKEHAFDKSFQHVEAEMSPTLVELQKTIIQHIQALPGNEQCCDCGSTNDVTWFSCNLGVLVCNQCAEAHREIGAQHARIQSLFAVNVTTASLLIARTMGNSNFNDIMEAKLGYGKPMEESTMPDRCDFISSKYVAKRYVMRTCSDELELRADLEQAIVQADLGQLLQMWAEGADLTCTLPSSSVGETALHLAVLRELGDSLYIVDFLIQNMHSNGLNKATNASSSFDSAGQNTALHLCAMHDRRECMRLLLRAGANIQLRNSQQKTALDIAKDMGHTACKDLLECAIRREKCAFEHININWNLRSDAVSANNSEDEIISSARSEASSNASTPARGRKKEGVTFLLDNLPINASRSGAGQIEQNSDINFSETQSYKTAPTVDMSSLRQLAAAKRALSRNTPSHMSTTSMNAADVSQPPSELTWHSSTPLFTATAHSQRYSSSSKELAGDSFFSAHSFAERPVDTKSNSSTSSDSFSRMERYGDALSSLPPIKATNLHQTAESAHLLPKVMQNAPPANAPRVKRSGYRRCRAIYDCTADNEDELDFKEGEVIIIINDQTDDENWLEGMIESDPLRRGMFPISFVHMLPE